MYLYLKRSEQSYHITDMDRPLGLQDVEAPRISRQSAQEGGKVSPTHVHLYSQQSSLIVIIVRG